ncbi:TrmH family RNA methyltransferase [Alkalihalobacterium alkalinitrilicum]|uniref:TrmH family RNA methyltransferase n=1 Tax=Alkalihalobacterium alkalinitrilicum TaxID=427920 RepID=UPI000994A751|nr:RNA methyltransferase [Alkalihalobacterium alkalinitrilicum]
MNRIESVKNPKVKQWKKLHTKKGRDAEKQFILEGTHLIEEARTSGIVPEELIISEEYDVPKSWSDWQVPITYVTDRVMVELSETRTPQGVIAICQQFEHLLAPKKGKYLFLDAVQDPGNVGTIIRTADAAGMDGVVLGDGSVDLYNGKVIRSTQGSLFHLPIIRGNLNEWVTNMKTLEIPVYGTALENGRDYNEVETTSSYALIVGNEGEGVSKELLKQTDLNLYVPIYGKAESLNVAIATAILIYGLRNQ